jgi:hypothetical protein
MELNDWVADRRIADRVRMGTSVLLDPRLMTDLDPVSGMLRVSLEGFVLGGAKQEVTVSVRVPDTWWDHWKAEVGSKWVANPSTRVGRWFKARMRWEVRTERSSRDMYARICPHGTINSPRPHVEWLVPGPPPPIRYY